MASPLTGFAAPDEAKQENSDFAAQIDQAIKTAETDHARLKQALEAEKQSYREMEEQNKIHMNGMESFRNLLIVPDINISVLRKSVEDISVSLSMVKSNIEKLTDRASSTTKIIATTREKTAFVTERIQALKEAEDKQNSYIANLKSYETILKKQEKVLSSLDEIIAKQLTMNRSLESSFQELSDAFKKQINDQKGKVLFQREQVPVKTFSVKAWTNEFLTIAAFFKEVVSGRLFVAKWTVFKKQITPAALLMVLSLAILSILCLKTVTVARQKQWYQAIIAKRTGYPLVILEHSIVPALLLLAAKVLLGTEFHIIFPDLLNFTLFFLMVFLVTRIASDALQLIVNESKLFFFTALYYWRKLFCNGLRIYAGIFLFVYWFISPQSVLLCPLRILSEILLTAGVFLFWNRYEGLKQKALTPGEKYINWATKALVLAGLFLELAGYTHFTSWWYTSLGLSMVVACLCGILYYAIADIDKKFIDRFEPESKKSFGISYPLYWMLSNAIYFLITAFALVGIAFSWGTGEAFLRGSALVFTKQIPIGNASLSLSGIVAALVVIVLTYLLVWFWKKLMDEHILKESGLSTGARDSIITISVYLVWTGGILISLGVLGLNTTSMAFAFGALGIGLGFGLQNIFNNFISGLILLFERPIQVGDVVEVGGNWGEVKKINVRSTLVQTYTTASLIIPNSEFISAQVTNWSHSDQKVRRDLPVGVAYGSDTELVQQLLLKAADNVKEVRNTPYRPAVQFINFGDSSLDFRLRFWSVLDDFVAGESRLRFEIDRLFRENNIQIPFPQRDIHHKTTYFPTDASGERP